MQNKSPHATPITPNHANRMSSAAAFDSWTGDAPSASLPHDRYDHDMRAPVQAYPVGPDKWIEDYLLADDEKYRGWKKVAVLAGGILATWTLVICCVWIVRAMLS